MARASLDARYSYVNYERRINTQGTQSIHVTRFCSRHGEFEQQLGSVDRGRICRDCARVDALENLKKRLTDEEIIRRAGINEKYPYVRHERRKNIKGLTKTWVVRRCETHGDFEQQLGILRKGCGCPCCSSNAPVTDEQIISRASCNPKYPPIRVERRKGKKQITIWVLRLCSQHGNFEQTIGAVERGRGCFKCSAGGFQRDQSGAVYYLRINAPCGVLYKIGITNGGVTDRYPSPRDQVLIEVVYQKQFEIGADAYAAEQQIIEDNIEHQYQGAWRFADGTGGRELFTQEINISSLFTS